MTWSCTAVRRRIADYHDGELTIDEQVVVQNHLASCEACAAEARGLDMVGCALRAASAERMPESVDRLRGLASGVVSRFKAEQEESLSRTFERMFEDMHLVWAALGATAATVACLAITVGVFYFTMRERPDSIAGLITALSNSGSNAYPVKMDASIAVPRQEETRVASMPDFTRDEVWAVNATISREGRVADLQLLGSEAQTQQNWNTIGRVLDAAAAARFEPARSGGSPVAVTNVIWLLEHLTVRPKARGEVRAIKPAHAAATVTSAA
ncbi:MAG: zf-HC2 domain-containing protein [Bacteroidales bacterium]